MIIKRLQKKILSSFLATESSKINQTILKINCYSALKIPRITADITTKLKQALSVGK